MESWSPQTRVAQGDFQLLADILAREGGIAQLVAPDLLHRQSRD